MLNFIVLNIIEQPGYSKDRSQVAINMCLPDSTYIPQHFKYKNEDSTLFDFDNKDDLDKPSADL